MDQASLSSPSPSPSSSILFHLLFLFLLLSPLLAPYLPKSPPLMLFLPQPSTLLPLLLTSPPASYFHLLSQGPCGTLRGWWGWGGWWCRWWWNSHSVSSLPVLELEASPYLSLSFPTYSSLISKRKGWGWGVRQVRKASCLCHSFIHASLCSTPHHQATYATCVCVCVTACVFSMPSLLSCVKFNSH